MSKNQPSKIGNGQHKPEGPTFSVNSIYVKDISFEAPQSPHIFNEEWQPKLDFDLQLDSQLLSKEEFLYEVSLHITLSVKIKENVVAFVIDLKQSGVFTLEGFEEDIIKQLLATTCPTVLFPYAREAISNLVQRGGFPQLILPPINFDAMYAHHLSEKEMKEAAQ